VLDGAVQLLTGAPLAQSRKVVKIGLGHDGLPVLLPGQREGLRHSSITRGE
jgi:hypothetical protein